MMSDKSKEHSLQNNDAPSQEVLQNAAPEDEAQPSELPIIKPQGDLKPGLYLVATPIGNLRDITFRALDTLASVDLIVCEDTRITGKLLRAYGFKKPMQVYNDHSSDYQRESIIKAVQSGQAIAVLSDAGTPLVSDPGYKLVRLAIENEQFITSIPGPSAALSGIQLSGLPTNQFSFMGFMPPKSGARISALGIWAETPGSLILYETGPRLADSLRDMAQVFGNREAAVTRELTKLYEEVRRGTLEELSTHYTENGAPKGEIVGIVAPKSEVEISGESLEKQIQKALETLSVRDASEMVAKATGKPRRAIYTLALKLSSK
jgi:16S rRNA (cytidine1402-2'-O)-methyltransferase